MVVLGLIVLMIFISDDEDDEDWFVGGERGVVSFFIREANSGRRG